MQKSLTELVGSTQYPIATLIASRPNELARELNGLTPAIAGDLSIACDGFRGQARAKPATEGSMTMMRGTCISTETLNTTDTAFTHYGTLPCSIS